MTKDHYAGRLLGWLVFGLFVLVVTGIISLPLLAGESYTGIAECQSRVKALASATLAFENVKGSLPRATDWHRSMIEHLPKQHFPIRPEQVLMCPKDLRNRVSYALNPAVGGKRSKDVNNPSTTVLLFEADSTGQPVFRHHGSSSRWCEYTHYRLGRHGSCCNLAFDGYVQWTSAEGTRVMGLPLVR